MPRCGTCAYRNAEGLCVSEKIGEMLKDYGLPCDDVLSYSYGEGGSFWVGVNFGCVHWKARHDPK